MSHGDLAYSPEHRGLRFWHRETHLHLFNILSHEDDINQPFQKVAFSANGRYVVASGQYTVKAWDSTWDPSK